MNSIILFDGSCNFCNGAVNIVIKHDKKGLFKFIAQQSITGNALLTHHGIIDCNINSIVLIQGGQVYFKMDAILQIGQSLTGWPRIILLFKYMPISFSNFLYTIVANNRYKLFGKRKECSILNFNTSNKISIVNYEEKYQHAFRELNVEWISKYFRMEEADFKALDNPNSYILDKGGHILVALLGEEPVGVCALIKMKDELYDFELAKMAVAPKAQGMKIGWMIGIAILEKARSVGAKCIFLESNTKLSPAISMYYKLGFTKVEGRPSPYERADIQMQYIL